MSLVISLDLQGTFPVNVTAAWQFPVSLAPSWLETERAFEKVAFETPS